jgi:CHAT domain-containing protein
VLLAGLGRSEEAIVAHRGALAAARRLRPRDEVLEAEVLGNLSLAYYQADDFERAERFLAQAVAIFEREGQHEHVARARRNFARFAAARGHYSKALAEVLPGRRRLLELGRVEAAAHLGQVGVDCLLRLNRSAEAAQLAAQVVAEFEATGGSIEAAATRGMRALALVRLGEREAALAELECAEQLFGTSAWQVGAAQVRLGRAVLLADIGQWQESIATAEAVRTELLQRSAVGRAAQADLVRARGLRGLGQTAAAADAVRSALALVGDRPFGWLSYEAWRLLGELARDAGDRAAARSAFLEAIGYLEQVQGRILTEYRASFLADKVDVYEAAVDMLLEDGEVQRAFELVERAKSRALVDALAGGLDVRVRSRTEQQARLVEELTRTRREHDDLVESFESNPRLRELEQRIGALLEELRLVGVDDLERLSLLQGRVYSPQPLLDPATALVEYYLVDHELVIFVVDADSMRARRIPDALPRLERLRRAWQLNLDAAASAGTRLARLELAARAVLQRLYELLLAPVAAWIAGYRRLVIVPHAGLHSVPFSALWDGQHHLIERYELSVAPSASSLTFCLRPRAAPSAQMLVVGHSADGALPGALAEARAVASLYDAECLLEEAATVAQVKRRACEAGVIHLAAHGLARPDAPTFSFLKLADGHLTALDCFELELECELVTLSACETGRGVIAPGDEQIGLPRAFLYAGARSVVQTLWRIEDRVTQQLMVDFYTGLRRGRGRAEALRQAQLQYLGGDATHPFLWAAPSLVGDWR